MQKTLSGRDLTLRLGPEDGMFFLSGEHAEVISDCAYDLDDCSHGGFRPPHFPCILLEFSLP